MTPISVYSQTIYKQKHYHGVLRLQLVLHMDDMMTSSNGIFSASLALCEGNHLSPVDSPHKGQWREAFNVFFDLCPNKRLGKQSRHWWFETPSRPLWRHRNERPIVYRRSIRMKTYIDTHMHIHFVGLILMLWHKKTQINPTKEPINYRAPGGDRTHANINKANLRDLIAATGILISSWIQIVNFSACVTVKFDGWPRKTIGHFFYLRQALCSIS